MLPLTKPPTFKPFKLALVQLGNIGTNKTENLRHAREMVLKAARGDERTDGKKPNLVVLPVSEPNDFFLSPVERPWPIRICFRLLALAGNLQLALWSRPFSSIRRAYRVPTRPTVRHLQ